MSKLFGLLGCPVSHSMSPAMHNDLFLHYGLNHYYHAFHVENENLEMAVNGLRALGVSGFNVTIPHKIAIIKYLDEIDEVAANIGAVNTVVNMDGKLKGFNTDGDGFIKSLESCLDSPLQNKRILIIGAGGAARAILFSLAAIDVHAIDVCNRTLSSAIQLIGDCSYKLSGTGISIRDAENRLNEYDIIINTTSVGMYPNLEEIPLSLTNLSPSTIVSDIIYNPLQTKLLLEAKQKGSTTLNGIGMFVNQGALAFEKWTGLFPDTRRMEELVINKLGGHVEC
ncbi:shikimate dehydrogenase [Cytobacillus suaedae]|nr:shikimate dehydrogenase [Cytobacillus suaedae]